MVLGLVLTSCGSNESNENSTTILKPESTKVSGELNTCYEVINKEYKIDNNDMYPVLSISIKRISDNVPFDKTKTVPYGTSVAGKNTHIGFGIELFDKDGNSIETINATANGLGGVYDSDDIQSIINLQNGETANVRWSIESDILMKAKSFRITSAMESVEISESGTSEDSDISEPGSMDELLDSYESYIDKYISVMQKVSKNDMSAIEEYPALIEQAEKLGTELDKNQDEMTSSQLNRFMKLQSKFTKAMSNL